MSLHQRSPETWPKQDCAGEFAVLACLLERSGYRNGPCPMCLAPLDSSEEQQDIKFKYGTRENPR